MAYNRRNLLIKILDVQSLVLKHQKEGSKQIWIYKNIIFPKYHMSIGTYYNYLNTNARKELKDLERVEGETKLKQ